MATDLKRRRPTRPKSRNKAGDDKVVLFDVDGVLADLSAFEYELDPDKPLAVRWRTFFTHTAEAKVIDSGFDLAWAIAQLGYTLVYSTTRPAYTHIDTRQWLTDHDCPPGALLSRPRRGNTFPPPAWQIKRAHAGIVQRQHPAWLRGFVDDEPDILDRLQAEQVPALPAAALADLTVRALEQQLETPLQKNEVRDACR